MAMKPKTLLLCCLLVAACAHMFGKTRGYAYWMEEPKWTMTKFSELFH